MEKTFVIIKPDAVKRGLVGKILTCFEERGFKILELDLEHANEYILKKHYEHLTNVPVFDQIISGMMNGPLVKVILEGKNAVSVVKTMVGATDPSKADLASIRGKYALDIGRNVCHASDSVDNANNEIALWFNNEIKSWTSPMDDLITRH